MFRGVVIKQFPKDTDDGEVMEFLTTAGLPESLKESVLIKDNGTAVIKGLDSCTCKKLIERIHNTKEFGRKLFCNGLTPMTPEKKENEHFWEDNSYQARDYVKCTNCK